MIAIAVVAWSGTLACAQAQDPSAVLAVQKVSRDGTTSKTTVTVKNVGTRRVTAWGMVFSSQQYTHELVYSVGMDSGFPGMRPAGFGGLLPGETLDVVLPSGGIGSTVEVNAVILEDRTAAGDEAETTAMFRYRAAYASEWQRWSLVLPANATPGAAERSEILRMLESPASPRDEAATAAGVTAARHAITLLLQGSNLASAPGYLAERAMQLRLHAQRAASSSTDAPPASTDGNARIELAISRASALRRETYACRAAGETFAIAAYADVFEGGRTAQAPRLEQLGAVALGVCSVPDSAPICAPVFLTSTSSSPASATITGVSLAYIPGIGCTVAASQTATTISRTFDKTLFRALDTAPVCTEPPNLKIIDPVGTPSGHNSFLASRGSITGDTIMAQVQPMSQGLENQVNWNTVPIGSQTAASNPNQAQSAATFRFVGVSNSDTTGSRTPNPPLGYNINATLSVSGTSLQDAVQISQDETDRIRQEYVDYATVFQPARGNVNSAALPQFNTGNYSLIAEEIAGNLLSLFQRLQTAVNNLLNNAVQVIPAGTANLDPANVVVSPGAVITNVGAILNTIPEGDDQCSVALTTGYCTGNITAGPNGIAETHANNSSSTVGLTGSELTSAYRNPQRNRAVGSTTVNSLHTRGRAFDIDPRGLAITGKTSAQKMCLFEAAGQNVATAFAERGPTQVACTDTTADHVHVQN
jgi:hypothetical protein